MTFELYVNQVAGDRPTFENGIGETNVRHDYELEYLGHRRVRIQSERYDEIAKISQRLNGIKITKDGEEIKPYKLSARVCEHRSLLYLFCHLASLCLLVMSYNMLHVTLNWPWPVVETIKTSLCIFISVMPWVLALILNTTKNRIAGIFVTKLINDELRLIRVSKSRQRWRVIGPSGVIKLDFTLWENEILIHKNLMFNGTVDMYGILKQLLAHHVIDAFETT